MARAVDRIAATLRERRELQGEVRALATQARTSAGGAGGRSARLHGPGEPPSNRVPWRSWSRRPLGLVCLVLGLGLDALGAVWMARITRRAA